ncbi:hypothetical protein [Nostoc sp.]|uniref:hypothetical protein n=1 Tax=Nostoc sp. TaxID=1180 RepID=UPI002FF9E806
MSLHPLYHRINLQNASSIASTAKLNIADFKSPLASGGAISETDAPCLNASSTCSRQSGSFSQTVRSPTCKTSSKISLSENVLKGFFALIVSTAKHLSTWPKA